jgi:hypothetical protein
MPLEREIPLLKQPMKFAKIALFPFFTICKKKEEFTPHDMRNSEFFMTHAVPL